MSEYADRIDELARRARADRDAFEPPADPPDEEAALRYLREGFGQALGIYLEARTGGPPVRFDPEEFERLETAANTWLSLYARCYDVRIDSDVTVRAAAEVFLDTHDVRETAAVLTHVPDGPGGDRGDAGRS